MDPGPISAVLQHVRRLAAFETTRALSDAQLLERFLASREETAFAALLHRHGPMVWRVCQRVLRHRQNAEDVFQATFLTLARKAAAIRKQGSVACWLHGVAYRLARRLQTELARKVLLGSDQQDRVPVDAVEQASGQELHAALDEELQRLAEKYRRPLVLCYLEGRTRDEAAEQLGWSLGTLKRRLDRGRKLLAARLTRRGVTLGVALFSAAVAQDAVSAAVPLTLVDTACKAASNVAAGEGATEVVSAQVAALAESMVHAMAMTKRKLAAAVILSVVTLVGAAGLWTAHQMQAGEPATSQAGFPVEPAREKPAPRAEVRDPLPALLTRGEYLVNQVARCGDCHTPRNADGGLDLSRHLQGAEIWFRPKVKSRKEWEEDAPDITASGLAGRWTEDRMVRFLSTGEESSPPMPAYRLSVEDARAITLYLRSLPGRTKAGAGKTKADNGG
jgi:RNA polymerase sigma factor (sigma-70 family)